MKDLIREVLQFIINLSSFSKLLIVFILALHFVVPLAERIALPAADSISNIHEQRAQIINNINK